MSGAIFPYLPVDKILASLNAAPGGEVESGKLDSPESSSALAVNTFGLFLDQPHLMPPLPGTEDYGWPAIKVGVEHCARFPWRGGRHPWLDAWVETDTHIIGIESKRYEPFRSKSASSFSEAYWRPVWGDHMAPYEGMRDGLKNGSIFYSRLNAVQLVKHAFGLRTEGRRAAKRPVLVYLYAEPPVWPDGKTISSKAASTHRHEAQDFGGRVAGAEVSFVQLTYKNLLASFSTSPEEIVCSHAKRLAEAFRPY